MLKISSSARATRVDNYFHPIEISPFYTTHHHEAHLSFPPIVLLCNAELFPSPLHLSLVDTSLGTPTSYYCTRLTCYMGFKGALSLSYTRKQEKNEILQ